MPYIDKDRRAAVLEYLIATSAGELNYLFTFIAINYLKTKGEKYQHYNDIIGALEGCKLEMYRRKAAHYEDQAIAKNGDLSW